MQHPKGESLPFLECQSQIRCFLYAPLPTESCCQTSGSVYRQGISEDRQNKKNQPSSAFPSGPGGKTTDTQQTLGGSKELICDHWPIPSSMKQLQHHWCGDDVLVVSSHGHRTWGTDFFKLLIIIPNPHPRLHSLPEGVTAN